MNYFLCHENYVPAFRFLLLVFPILSVFFEPSLLSMGSFRIFCVSSGRRSKGGPNRGGKEQDNWGAPHV